SGALATKSDLVFYGTMDGWFKAVDARNGRLLWKHKMGSGTIAAPMTYLAPDGKQYVAIYAGVGGWFGAPVSLDLPPDDPFGALGAVGVAYGSGLDKATTKGGMLYVFGL
ncbi:MAG: PQQ-dependent dehydrogenase, methanol/ethanol family, partial [candidate division NC10 bacterium]